MATNIVMPQMGYDMREGTVVRWHKKEGETVSRGDVIAEIETDKATVEFEAYTGGVMGRIVAEEGVVIPVGDLIAVITAPGEEVPQDSGSPPVQAETPAAVPDAPVASANSSQPAAAPAAEVRASPIARRLAQGRGLDLVTITGTGPGGRIVEKDVLGYAPETASTSVGWVLASPLARRLAREQGVDLARISGTGPGGRIIEKDVLGYTPTAAAQAGLAVGEALGEKIELTRMRQAIARVTVDSKREAPHFYLASDVDMTKAMSFREDINQAILAEDRVGVNDLIVKAAAMALGKYPKFNSSFQGEYLQLNTSINIGIAIALEAGLMVPGISNCEAMTLVEIAAASKGLIQRANSGHLRNEEYSGTTFSVSNLGMFEVDSFAAIIFPPHAAVLAVGRVKEQPVVRNGELAVAQIMTATLSTDHRVADGAEAAQFLMELKKTLENPVSLLL